MEDVILYNESWDIDKLSPYNTFYMEGSIIDGLKRIWKAFLDLLKRIKQRLQYTFGKDERTYRRVVQGLKNPGIVEDWKRMSCAKWDYSVTKELLAKGDELCECILNAKDIFANVESTEGHWSPSTISRLNNHITDVDKINAELKAVIEKEARPPIENGQSVYDLATDWVEIYELGVRYWMHHDEVMKFIKEMDKTIKSLPENQASFTTKLVQKWCVGLKCMYTKELVAPKGAMVNARVDSRDSFVQVKTMLDDNTKILEKALNDVREANKNADKSIKDTERFMRNNKALFKKYDPYGESYTKGMNGMDVILYNDTVPEYEEPIQESAENEPNLLEQLDTFIESTIERLNEAMDMRARIIQESDDGATDTSSSDVDASSDDGIDSPDTVEEECSENKDKARPVKESYVLDGSAIFGESYNHMDDVENTMPNRFVQEFSPEKVGTALGLLPGYTMMIAGVTADVMLIVRGIDSIVASATYKKKYGRFADDMKDVMDILKDSKDGTIKTDLLHKALSKLKDDCDTISGKGVISIKAQTNLTATERSEIKQLSTIIKDLKRMLTAKPDKAAERRISARIEDFVNKCDTVTKLLNRGKNPGDVVKEYMS